MAKQRRRIIGIGSAIIALAAGVLLGTGGYTFSYAEGFSYFSDDPAACVNCHIMRDQFDGWQKASHHAVATCNDCHVPHDSLAAKFLSKARNGYHHSRGFTLDDFHEPIRITPVNREILEANCVRCHRETVSWITAHAGAGETDCVRCHRDVGHGPSWD